MFVAQGVAGTRDSPLGLYTGQLVLHGRAEAAVLCSSPDQCIMLAGGGFTIIPGWPSCSNQMNSDSDLL